MNTEKIKFAKESIAKLREKILVGSTTNRNKIIKFKHQDKKRDQVRVVDASINQIYSDLSEGKNFIFKSIPEEERDPKDEQSQDFLDAYEIAKREDEVYKKEVIELGELYDGGNKESLEIERSFGKKSGSIPAAKTTSSEGFQPFSGSYNQQYSQF